MTVEVARARLDVARSLEEAQPEVAVGEARTALAEFELLGAPRDADAAAELLRRHGVRGRTGPKDAGLFTRREQEVLQLVARGAHERGDRRAAAPEQEDRRPSRQQRPRQARREGPWRGGGLGDAPSPDVGPGERDPKIGNIPVPP